MRGTNCQADASNFMNYPWISQNIKLESEPSQNMHAQEVLLKSNIHLHRFHINVSSSHKWILTIAAVITDIPPPLRHRAVSRKLELFECKYLTLAHNNNSKW